MDIFKLREMYLRNNSINKSTETVENKSTESTETVENKSTESTETVENKLTESTDIVKSIKESKSENINELFELLSRKINNIELIDESLIIEIYDRLKLIRKNHNTKISNWYDDKFYEDLNEFKKNNISFSNLMKYYQENSFVLI